MIEFAQIFLEVKVRLLGALLKADLLTATAKLRALELLK
jgi:hypothetical protein